MQGDQKISVHLMITIQLSGAQRLFDHPVYHNVRLVRLDSDCQLTSFGLSVLNLCLQINFQTSFSIWVYCL
jgi:hypothetical protein